MALHRLTMVALLAATHLTQSGEGSDVPFELVLGLPLQRLATLEARFWAIASPSHADYLQHMALPELRALIGATEADISAAQDWLRALGAVRWRVSALGDTVVGEFEGERAARASAHWEHWDTNAAGVRLPSKANHSRPLQYLLRRDRLWLASPKPAHLTGDGSCQSALRSSCSTDAAKAHSPFASEPCTVCAGHLQHQLRVAGCTDEDIQAYCRAETPIRTPYDVTAQKAAYRMPTSLTATHPNTLQMVWGPGTFGFDRGALEV